MNVTKHFVTEGVMDQLGNIAKTAKDKAVDVATSDVVRNTTADVLDKGVGGALADKIATDASNEVVRSGTQKAIDTLTKPMNVAKLGAATAGIAGLAGAASAAGKRVGNVGRKRGQINEGRAMNDISFNLNRQLKRDKVDFLVNKHNVGFHKFVIDKKTHIINDGSGIKVMHKNKEVGYFDKNDYKEAVQAAISVKD